jgi:hypothetical protein
MPPKKKKSDAIDRKIASVGQAKKMTAGLQSDWNFFGSMNKRAAQTRKRSKTLMMS